MRLNYFLLNKRLVKAARILKRYMTLLLCTNMALVEIRYHSHLYCGSVTSLQEESCYPL